ncbi:MAG: MBL fold metallo-hydrolase [Pedosphaera sp.]|nr:MBL fold metallo-hydrolase [Pedosphaera sp.]MST00614.1 MBL fold metallo-hydrolase [Pedosphaera sp.]
MSLEDHVGDILRKARIQSKGTAAAAAAAAGLSEDDYAMLEESGRIIKRTDLFTAAALVGVSGGRLENIAKGWEPETVYTECWRELRTITTTDNFSVNCYLVWDEVTREAALFDTGWDAAPIFKHIDEHKLELKYIFITHGHSDHMACLPAVRARFPKTWLRSGSKHAPVDQRNRANDFIHLGSLRITNRPTPGHAEDGVTYVVGNWPEDAAHVAFVGDAIFAGSMGKDFHTPDEAKRHIREQILSLPPDTLICSGHGPITTVKQEREHNPFFVY